MKRTIPLWLLVIVSCVGLTLSAQSSHQAALALVTQLDAVAARVKTPGSVRNELRDLLANLRLVLETDPGCPASPPCPECPACPACPQPPACTEPEPCPTCPDTETPPPTETCGNGVDDDKDGTVDEDCPQVPEPGTSPNVSTSAELMAAIDNPAIPEIRLAKGIYTIKATIRRPVIIQGAQGLTGRVSAEDVADWRLVAQDPLWPVLTIAGAVTDVVVRGVTLTGGGAKDRPVILIGSNMATDVAEQPSRVTIDQTAVIAVDGFGHRGIEAHGSDITITRNYIARWIENGRDSQGIHVVNGPGPYHIEDNYIEASGQAILFGGDTVRIQGLVPSDITVRRNTLYKAPDWIAISDVKNAFELKCARRVLFESNLVDGNWKDAQDGSAILLTVRNQYGGSPWCIVDDVTLRKNIVRNTPHAYVVNILGSDNNHPSEQTKTVTITGNLFEDGLNGIRVARGVTSRLTVTNNTAPRIAGSFLYFISLADGVPIGGYTPTTLEKNVFRSGAYGVFGEGGVTPGTGALQFWSNGDYSATGNLIERSAVRTINYPAGNTLVAPGTLLGLLDETTYTYGDRTIGY